MFLRILLFLLSLWIIADIHASERVEWKFNSLSLTLKSVLKTDSDILRMWYSGGLLKRFDIYRAGKEKLSINSECLVKTSKYGYHLSLYSLYTKIPSFLWDCFDKDDPRKSRKEEKWRINLSSYSTESMSIIRLNMVRSRQRIRMISHLNSVRTYWVWYIWEASLSLYREAMIQNRDYQSRFKTSMNDSA